MLCYYCCLQLLLLAVGGVVGGLFVGVLIVCSAHSFCYYHQELEKWSLWKDVYDCTKSIIINFVSDK